MIPVMLGTSLPPLEIKITSNLLGSVEATFHCAYSVISSVIVVLTKSKTFLKFRILIPAYKGIAFLVGLVGRVALPSTSTL